MNADDVLKALEEIEFPDFLNPLKASLDGQLFISHFHSQVYCFNSEPR